MPNASQTVLRGWWTCLVLCGVGLSGCGQSMPANYVKATGRVTFQGQALPQGVVNYVCPEVGSGTAILDSGGKFTLYLPPGTYQISVTSVDGDDKLDEKGSVVTPAKSLIPEKYSDAATSGLTAKVEKGKANDVELELK